MLSDDYPRLKANAHCCSAWKAAADPTRLAPVSDRIENPRTGQRMTFVTDRPELLEIDTINPRTAVREPEHVHPKQETGTRIVSGSLRFKVDGDERSVGPGP